MQSHPWLDEIGGSQERDHWKSRLDKLSMLFKGSQNRGISVGTFLTFGGQLVPHFSQLASALHYKIITERALALEQVPADLNNQPTRHYHIHNYMGPVTIINYHSRPLLDITAPSHTSQSHSQLHGPSDYQ